MTCQSPLAIILAAGAGRRLGRPEPKPLLPLPNMPAGHGSLLERHLTLLCENRCEVLVVVPKSDLDAYASLKRPGVTFVASPFPPTDCGSTMSLAVALDTLPAGTERDVLIFDCDIVYERSLIVRAVSEASATRLFVYPAKPADGEEVRIFGRESGPLLIGKSLPQAITANLDDFGESVGLIAVAASDLPLLRAVATWLVGRPPADPAFGFSKERSEHEEVWQYFCTIGRIGVAPLSPHDIFAECDTPADYRHILDVILPEIRRRDVSQSPIVAQPESLP